MTPRKQSKRMWGVFDWNDALLSVERTETAAEHECLSGMYIAPLTVTWSSPNKRKAKR